MMSNISYGIMKAIGGGATGKYSEHQLPLKYQKIFFFLINLKILLKFFFGTGNDFTDFRHFYVI